MSDKSIVREITRHMIAEGRLVADPEGRAAYFRLARWIDERYGEDRPANHEPETDT